MIKKPKIRTSRRPHVFPRTSAKPTPKTSVSSGSGDPRCKGKQRVQTSAASSPDDDDSSDAGSQNLAALSRSRSSSRCRVQLSSQLPLLSSFLDLIVVYSPSPAPGFPVSSIAATSIPKLKNSKVDLYAKASSIMGDATSVSEESRARLAVRMARLVPRKNPEPSSMRFWPRPSMMPFPRPRYSVIRGYPDVAIAFQNHPFKPRLGPFAR